MKTNFEWDFKSEAKKLRALKTKMNSDVKPEKQIKLISNNQDKRKRKNGNLFIG